ncbi:MAG: SDR family oxidoreductase [Proteobacteria bacterium]|nr:SDR family oxidoreductase [Pseudomonadota bacterium]
MAGMLAGRAAVITGGGTGIGADIARLFTREGAHVIVAGRRAEPLRQIADATGAKMVVCDVVDEAAIKSLIGSCEQAFGRLDILVNNAAFDGPEVAAEHLDIRDYDKVMAVNVRALMLCIKYAIPLLKRQGGSIINMSSRMGLHAKPNKSPYAASKFAVFGITQSVAQEVGVHGIRVNAICPGGTDTAMWRHVIAERAQHRGVPEAEVIRTGFVDNAALRRIINPREVAEAALFLASDAASAITGIALKVDAGRM